MTLPHGPDDGPDKGFRSYAQYAHLGIQFGLSIFVVGGLGYVLDRWQGISPFGLIFGVFLGAFVGFWNLYRAVYKGTNMTQTRKNKED